MDEKYCCNDFAYFVTTSKDDFTDTNKLIYHDIRFDEYGLIIHDGGQSYIVITHCPWTGEKLPESKKELWFDELEARGFEDPLSEYDSIPNEYKSDKWMTLKEIQE
ncbi:DUF6980 family protein [uncultured Enterococcus sp.]|uniref:DUF6980 family protein n=1 Tax=uncultured Enterococcus sp. TaxID=167972 RepID=UPI002AA7F514|nr:hypothetical protein [uncultured Enterococcus sp.]